MSDQRGATVLFMGEQADPELEVWLGRGLRVYGALDARCPPAKQLLRAAPIGPPPLHAGLYVSQGGGVVAKCGCGKCFYGPCPEPAPSACKCGLCREKLGE